MIDRSKIPLCIIHHISPARSLMMHDPACCSGTIPAADETPVPDNYRYFTKEVSYGFTD